MYEEVLLDFGHVRTVSEYQYKGIIVSDYWQTLTFINKLLIGLLNIQSTTSFIVTSSIPHCP